MVIENINDMRDPKRRASVLDYLHRHAVGRSQCTLAQLEDIVSRSAKGALPQYYIVLRDRSPIGYILMIADQLSEAFAPFAYLLCHNGDELSFQEHRDMLSFIVQEAKAYKAPALQRINEHHLSVLLEQDTTK